MLGERESRQASAICIGVAWSPAATSASACDWIGAKPPREEGHIGDAPRCQTVDQRIIFAIREIILVLHADDGRDPHRLVDLSGGDVAGTARTSVRPAGRCAGCGQVVREGQVDG